MKTLLLEFAGSPVPELIRMEYEDPVQQRKVVALRGRDAGVFDGCTGFPWTSAVKAFSLLMLRAAASLCSADLVAPVLIGARRSSAASLDNALCKQPLWLMDMFGCDMQGSSNLRRLLSVNNSGLKRAGPVSIAVHRHVLTELKAIVLHEQRVIASAEEILNLAAAINRDTFPHL